MSRSLPHKLIPLALLVCVLSACQNTPVVRATAVGTDNASIPYARRGGIRDWRADGERGLWVRDRSGQWYYGKFIYPCFGLQFSPYLRYTTSPSGAFDKWSEVQARETARCQLVSLTRAVPPPGDKAPAATPAPTAPAAVALSSKAVG